MANTKEKSAPRPAGPPASLTEINLVGPARNLAPEGIAWAEGRLRDYDTRRLRVSMRRGKSLCAGLRVVPRRPFTITLTVPEPGAAPKVAIHVLPSLRRHAGAWCIEQVPVDAHTTDVIDTTSTAYMLVGDRVGMLRSINEMCPDLHLVGYRDANIVVGSIEDADANGGSVWFDRECRMELADLDEAVVLHIGWCAHTWLRKTDQIPGRISRSESSRFAVRWLEDFRVSRMRQKGE